MASIFERFKNLVTKNSQQTNLAFNRAIYNFLGETLITSEDNDESYINKGYRFNSTVYAIVNLITKAASTVPFQVYEVQNSNELKRYKALTSGDFGNLTNPRAQISLKNALVELQDTELHELLDRPNPAQSYSSFISEIIAFGKLTGNRYIYGIAPENGINAGKYGELYVLPSQTIEIHSGGLMKPVDHYTMEYNGTYRMLAEDVCHIKDYNPLADGTGANLYGMSPLKAGLRSMDANNEALTTGVRYLQNQTARGVLMSEEGDLNEMQARQLKEKFRKQYQGSNNAGDVIITPKKLSWVNFGLNAADLSLIEQYNTTIKDLCNIYNIPAVLLNNVESATYNNIKEARKMLYTNAVIPELYKIRDELNRWLAPKFGDKLFIDFDTSVIPELQEESEKIVEQMAKSWWLTPNEKRMAMSYGKDEENSEMDDYYVPANLLPIGNSDMPDMTPDPIKEDSTEKRLVSGMNDVFTTIAEARARANEMGGEGYHEHIFDGFTVYMPFETHEEYEAAKDNKLDEYYGEIDADAFNYDFELDSSYYDTDSEYDDDENTESEDLAIITKAPQISETMERALRNKVEDHNEKYGDDPAKRATYSMLARSFVRGVGAYRTNPSSVRPSVNNEQQWALGRVNGLLYALRTGKFRRRAYDTDLLPEAHNLSSKKTKAETFDDYPQGATNNAKRMLEWREKYGRSVVQGGTSVGWQRANQLAKREALSLSTVKRINSFLARHKENAKIDPQYKDEPWRDKGYVAYNLWGGAAMVAWAKRISENA